MRNSAFAVLFVLFAFSAVAQEEICKPGQVWNYCTCGGCEKNGPANWGTVAASECASTTLQQSPADLPSSTGWRAIGPITFNYGAPSLTTKNSRQGVKLYPATSQTINVGPAGLSYRLVELHAHVPNEHTLPGVAAVAELHFVHERGTEPPTAIAVFLKLQQGDNRDLEPIITAIDRAPACRSAASGIAADLRKLIPPWTQVLEYTGSLTTPPCTRVHWLVLNQAIGISASQLSRLNIYGANARPAVAMKVAVFCWPSGANCTAK
jgi:carbonic anhydrase